MQRSMAVILICNKSSTLLCFISSTILNMHKKIKYVSFNIAGLCNPSNWKLFCNYITSSQADVICVQENNQGEFNGQVGSLGGFDIVYAGQRTTVGVLILLMVSGAHGASTNMNILVPTYFDLITSALVWSTLNSAMKKLPIKWWQYKTPLAASELPSKRATPMTWLHYKATKVVGYVDTNYATQSLAIVHIPHY